MTSNHIISLSSLGIFVCTLLTFGLSVDQIWYREDDLGQIINGIIRSKEDVVRVFSADERDFIVPINFKRSKANVISGFLRPLKHVFFTGIYAIWGLEVKAYLWLHVTVHALNAVLFYLLLMLLLPIWLSTLGGLLFAFYPDNSWLVWIAATHNSLATFFLLAALLLFARYYDQPSSPRSTLFMFCSGFLFLLSLLARENGIFFPFWLAIGIMLYCRHHHQIWYSTIKKIFTATWPFFTGIVIYTGMRLWAFGIQTLDRTLFNLTLRFPFCKNLIPEAWLTTKPIIASIASTPVLPTTADTISQALRSPIINSLLGMFDSFFSWSSIMFCLDHHTTIQKTAIIVWWIILIMLFWQAYRKQTAVLLFLIIGFYCFSWQAFLAYPATRYINTAYPIIIALVLMGLNHIKKTSFLFGAILIALGYALGHGIYNNVTRLHNHAASMMVFKERYAQFFTNPPFSGSNNFIVLGSPFVSDIQNSIQYFLNDLSIKVAHELFATVAEQGYFGCRGDYRITGVASSIIPIDQGFRFISNDEEHCAWWMHFSDYPLRWSASDGAYRWSAEKYTIGIWYPTPLGAFKINRQNKQEYNTDISFILDPQWINQHTVIVSWDTLQGKYITLSSTHLSKSFT